MLCFEIFESATQFNREYKRFFGKPRCETFERFFLRVLRNSNWSVVAESVFVAFTLWPQACALGLSEYHPVCSERIVGNPEVIETFWQVARTLGWRH
jgi:hypothetical protein